MKKYLGRENEKKKKTMKIDRLPNELFHLIVTYLTNDYREVLLFGTVCRDWKDICDTSVVWKTCDLKFRLPLYDERSITQGFQLAELPHTIRFRRDVSRVVVYDVRIPPNDVTFDELVKPGFQEECRRIKLAFMELLGGYRLLWRKYRIWVNVDQFFKKYYTTFFAVSVTVGLTSLLIARYHFPSLFRQTILSANNMEKEGVELIYFFVAIYSFFVVLIVLFGGGVARELAIQNTDRSKLKSVYFEDMEISYDGLRTFLFFLFPILGWVVSIVLLQLKLVNHWHNLSYDTVIRPQYLCNAIGLVLLLRNSLKQLSNKIPEFIVITQCVFVIPTSLSILAEVNDARFSSNISCFRDTQYESFNAMVSNFLHSPFTLTDAIYPLLPQIFIITSLSLFRLKSTFELFYDHFHGSITVFEAPRLLSFINNRNLYLIAYTVVSFALICAVGLILKGLYDISNISSPDCTDINPMQYWLSVSDVVLMFAVYLGLLVLQLRIPTLRHIIR